MKTHGMLFKSEMIQALLAGSKTQTRRLKGLEQANTGIAKPSILNQEVKYDGRYWVNFEFATFSVWKECQYAPGDLIYAKENCWITKPNFGDPSDTNCVDYNGCKRYVGYSATMSADSVRCARDYGVKQSPSIFMPRWASRIWLRVTDMRCERLQEITERDAIDEGCSRTERAEGAYYLGGVHKVKGTRKVFNCARGAYADLWDSINTDPGTKWDANPWIFRIQFERVEKPT